MKRSVIFFCFTLCTAYLLSYDILIDSASTQNLGYGLPSQQELNGEKDLLQEILQPEFCIVDGGANVGTWSQAALSIQPSTTILAFEPIPVVYEQYKKNLSQHPSARALNLALSNEEGKRECFFLYGNAPDQMQASSCHLQATLGQPDDFISIEQTTLDAFCKREKIQSIDLLKLDVEGHELFALKGASDLLKQKTIHAIQFEYGETFKGSKTTLKQIYSLLTSHGYLIFRIIPNGCIYLPSWSDKLENFQYSNFFAILPTALHATWSVALKTSELPSQTG